MLKLQVFQHCPFHPQGGRGNNEVGLSWAYNTYPVHQFTHLIIFGVEIEALLKLLRALPNVMFTQTYFLIVLIHSCIYYILSSHYMLVTA